MAVRTAPRERDLDALIDGSVSIGDNTVDTAEGRRTEIRLSGGSLGLGRIG